MAYQICIIDEATIDRMNILQATLQGMVEAVQGIKAPYHEVWIDGNRAPQALAHQSKTIIDGDALEPCISAASILAKVTRDRLMLAYDQQFPQYGFAQHKGYGTKQHLLALQKYGHCAIHRRSFAPVRATLPAVACN